MKQCLFFLAGLCCIGTLQQTLRAESVPVASQDEASFIQGLTARQVALAQEFERLSYHARIEQQSDDSHSGLLINQTRLVKIMRRGQTTLINIEADSIPQQLEQRDKDGRPLPPLFQQINQPKVSRVLFTKDFMAVWDNLAEPVVYLRYPEDWEEERYARWRQFWHSPNIQTLCFGGITPFFQLIERKTKWETWHVAENNEATCVLTRETHKSPQDLLLKLDLEHSALLLHETYTPPTLEKSTVDITYMTASTGEQPLQVPSEYIHVSTKADGTLKQSIAIKFDSFADDYDSPAYGLKDLGMPDRCRVLRDHPHEPSRHYEWKGGALEEIATE